MDRIRIKAVPPRFRSIIWTLFGMIFLLIIWEIASRIYGSGLLLPGPVPVLGRLAALVRTSRFLSALAGTFVRVFCGIGITVPLGLIAGIAAGMSPRARAFLKPLFSVISATPVMSIILIVFLFLGSARTPVFTAFLMVFPVMAHNAIEGICGTDIKLKELFASFEMNRRETLRYLYIPSILPFILAGLRSSLSLCWKVVVAAEVMVQPLGSLGAGMQQAKANLETTELFAWTAATVLAAAISQVLLFFAVRRYSGGAGKK